MIAKILTTLFAFFSYTTICAQPGLSYFDINISTTSSPSSLTLVNNTLFFAAFENATGEELYSYDGGLPPKLHNDLNPGAGYGISYEPMIGIDDTLFFLVHTSIGKAIYKLLPSSSTPVIASICIAPLPHIPANTIFVAYSKQVIYTTMTNDSTMAIVKINAASVLPDTIIKMPTHTFVRELVVCGDRLYITSFFGYNPNPTSFDLHCYNLTNSINTVLYTNKGEHGYTGNKIAVGNDLYFFQTDPAKGYELHKHDGVSTPVCLTDLNPGLGHGVMINTGNIIGEFNSKIYFSGANGTVVAQLAEYDITTTNTKIIPNSAYPIMQPKHMFGYHNKLYFIGYSSQTGAEIFMYDGTNPPKLLLDVEPGPQSSNPASLTVYNNNLFFAATLINSIQRELFIYNDSALSIKRIDSSNISITLYPNPTTQDAYLDIHLDKAQTFSVQLTDIQGRIVYKNEVKIYSQGSHKLTIPMQHLAASTYVYRVYDESGGLLNSGKLLNQ